METFTETPDGRVKLLRAILTPDNYADVMRQVRRRSRITQHYAAVLYKEQMGEQANINSSSGSQISTWETGTLTPMLPSFLRWANALGCDVVLVPRRDITDMDYIDPDEDQELFDVVNGTIEPQWSEI